MIMFDEPKIYSTPSIGDFPISPVNEVGYVSLEKTISGLTYRGELSQLHQLTELYDCGENLDTLIKFDELKKMSITERIDALQDVKQSINAQIMSGEIKKREKIELDKKELEKIDRQANILAMAQRKLKEMSSEPKEQS